MTDNEIIKALECCRYDDYDYCEECPYRKNKPCQENLIQDTFDLINRQKAELEKNENIIRLADKTIATQQAEIERLNKCVKTEDEVKAIANATIQASIKIIRAEAVKEFAEGLNKEAEKVEIDRDGDFVTSNDKIYDTVADWCKEISNNLLKQMVGENDGKN